VSRGSDVEIRALTAADLTWAEAFLDRALSGRWQARRGELIDVLDGEALVAWRDGRRVGLASHRPDGPRRLELTALAAAERGSGIGSALVAALVEVARAAVAREIRVTTTGDNLTALGFYQRRGFRLVELRAGAVDDARRRLKPGIPEVAENGLPLRDELELALEVDPAA
jgi:ribosomal protein S18 acetylase RimI-like enzyme